jgi:hypothetical protein
MERSETHPKLALASGEYDLRKAEARKAGWPTRVTIPKIEKEFGLKPKTLTCYRANHFSRKDRR